MNHTLDASAVLRYLDNEAGVGEIKRLLLDGSNQRSELFVNAQLERDHLRLLEERRRRGAIKNPAAIRFAADACTGRRTDRLAGSKLSLHL